MPTMLFLRVRAVHQRPNRLDADVGREDEELDGHQLWARSSALWERVREPVKRQTITTLAKPSMAESMPNPIRAMDPATMPATMATTPSRAI